jgi:DNA-binding NtrC family response regulator
VSASAAGSSRVVVLAVPDAVLREHLRRSLAGMRWQVMEAAGGAEAMACMDECAPEAVVMDNWLPDLEVSEFATQVQLFYPAADVLRLDGSVVGSGFKSPRRHELLHAVREAQESMPLLPSLDRVLTDDAAWVSAPVAVPDRLQQPSEPQMSMAFAALQHKAETFTEGEPQTRDAGLRTRAAELQRMAMTVRASAQAPVVAQGVAEIAGMIGQTEVMRELTRMIRLVAPRSTRVLIEGETGTGKEVVARSLHALSTRVQKPFAVLNCAAIPEALLEAELFGHTRGAFTGAVTSRTGRIEAANGGTLFLDEIGEMPLPLQSKMLRFLENGELQRVGDNEVVRVDVRILAATHQHLEQRAAEGTFRLDLYHRLAVFPLHVPALRERLADLPLLAEFFLEAMGRDEPRRHLSSAALEQLMQYSWPGNVRELGHVLERATILAGDRSVLDVEHVRLRQR